MGLGGRVSEGNAMISMNLFEVRQKDRQKDRQRAEIA